MKLWLVKMQGESFVSVASHTNGARVDVFITNFGNLSVT